MTRERMQALRYANDDVDAVTRLVELHLRFHTYRMGWTDSAVRRFVRDAGDLLDELIVLTRCDCTTRNEKKAVALSRRMDELEARIAELRGRGGAARPAPGPRRPTGDGAPRRRRPDLSSARHWRSCSSCASRRARSGPTRPSAASTPGGRSR